MANIFESMLGLGVVLEFHDRASSEIKKAGDSFKKLKGDALDTAIALDKRATELERQIDRARKNVATGMKEILAGSAMVTAPALFVRLGMEAEGQLSKIGITMIAQGKSIDVVNSKLEQYDDLIDKIANNTVGVADSELLKGFDVLLSRLGEDVAVAGIEQLGKFSEALKVLPDQAAEFNTAMLALFGEKVAGATPLEKLSSIMDTSAAVTGLYKMNLEELGMAMAAVGPEVKLMGLGFEEVLAPMALFLESGQKSRMVGGSMKEVFANLLSFEQKINEMKKAGQGTPTTLQEYYALQKKAIPRDILPFTNIRMTDATGKLLPFLQILKNIKAVTDKMGPMSASQKTFFSSFLGADVGVLIGHLDQVEKKMTDLGNRTGEVDRQFGFLQGKASHEWQLVKNQLGDVAEQIGLDLLPAAAELFKSMRGVTKTVGDLVKHNPELVKWGFYLWTGAGAIRTIGGTLLAAKGIGEAIYGTVALRGVASRFGSLTTGGIVPPVGTGGAAAAGAGVGAMSSYLPHILAAAVGAYAGKYTYENFIRPLREKSFIEIEVDASTVLQKLITDGVIPEPKVLGGKLGEAFNEKVQEALSGESASAFGLKIGEAIKMAIDPKFDWESFDPGDSAVMREAKRLAMEKKTGLEYSWQWPTPAEKFFGGTGTWRDLFISGKPDILKPSGRGVTGRSREDSNNLHSSSFGTPDLSGNPFIQQTFTGALHFTINGANKDGRQIASEVKANLAEVADRAAGAQH